MSVFHQKLGLVISGANSKHQPELATFSEKFDGQTYHTPVSSRLEMSDAEDRLSLAYNTFFSDLYVPAPKEDHMTLRFVITGEGTPPEEARPDLATMPQAGRRSRNGDRTEGQARAWPGGARTLCSRL